MEFKLSVNTAGDLSGISTCIRFLLERLSLDNCRESELDAPKK